MLKIKRKLAILVGITAVLAALLGFMYNFFTLSMAYKGSFGGLIAKYDIPYFYQAFYIMSFVCCSFYVSLAWCGIDLVLRRYRSPRFLVVVLLLEILYFLAIHLAIMTLAFRMSIAAAMGVANGGLMFQFFVLFPIWGPLSLWWAGLLRQDSINMNQVVAKPTHSV